MNTATAAVVMAACFLVSNLLCLYLGFKIGQLAQLAQYLMEKAGQKFTDQDIVNIMAVLASEDVV